MSGVVDYTVLEILELEPVSTRLRNAVNRAYQRGDMPCNTVLEYNQSKEKVIRRLYGMPSVGDKTRNELVSLLEKYSQGTFREITPDSAQVSIPDALKGVSIASLLRLNNCTVRLKNALTGAINRREFLAEELGDLHDMSLQELRVELRRVPNLGSKSVEEFIELLSTLSSDTNEMLTGQESSRKGNYSQPTLVGWSTNYQTLLEKARYDDITVAGVIRKTPGLLKHEEKVLKTLKQEYADMVLSEVMASHGCDLNKVANTLVQDKKLSKYLVSLLMEFYRFLSDKISRRFSHKEYFSKDFSALDKKHSDILLSRFGTGKRTLEELGKEYGVTRERIRQIEVDALKSYIKSNRVGLFHLSENIEKYVKASKGVLSINVIERLWGVARQKLELILNLVIPRNGHSGIFRSGEYLVNTDFKMRQSAIFEEIKKYIYRSPGSESQEIIKEIEGINRQILGYFLFVNHKSFFMNAEGDINIVTNSASERARIVLTAAGQPLHTSEAASFYKSIFREDVTEHALGATLGRLRDVLIVGPGTYALYLQLNLSSLDIDFLRDEAHSFIEEKNRYLSTRILLEHFCRIRPDLREKEPYFNYHLVLGLLQDDDRFRTRRGFMVGLQGFGDHLPLETEIAELVETHGPVSIPELMERLRPTRGELTNGSVRNSLLACDEIYLTAEKRRWDVRDRVFSDASDVRRLQIAIRMAAYKESIALSSVYNRVRSTGIEYALGTILSVIWKDPDIKLDGDYVCFLGNDSEIERYYATEKPNTLWQLDYRNHTEEKSVDTSVVDALVKEFDLYV